MNVRCERCQTEYELEDGRLVGGAATVKCTQCGHVFAVNSAEKPLFSGGFESGRPLDGRVKQANGNVFQFRDLSMLQRWIVERKVTRDDEVSLSGEGWTRLGNLPDLAAFFLVVEEAQRGLQLLSLQHLGLLSSPGSGDQKIQKYRSPTGTLVLVFIGFVALGAAVFYWVIPRFRPVNPPAEIAEAEVLILDGGGEPDAGSAAEDDGEEAKDEVDAGPTSAPSPVKAPPLAKESPTGVIDAGITPVHDFNFYMKQADRLREREKYSSALNAYGKASDLSPNSPEPIAGKGLVLLDMGQTLHAEAAFEEALKRGPRYAVALMGMAETYRAQGKKEQAVHYYESYLDVLPNGPESNVAREAIRRLQEE